jgi:hypothetical protein
MNDGEREELTALRVEMVEARAKIEELDNKATQPENKREVKAKRKRRKVTF